MWKDIREKREEMSKLYVKSQRHTIQVPYIPFLVELAKLNGCNPDLGMKLSRLPFLAQFYYWYFSITGQL